MVTTAVTVIFVTCLLQGVTIKPLLNALKVERKTIEKTNISEQVCHPENGKYRLF